MIKARHIDVFEFAQRSGEASGEVALSDLDRYVGGLPEQLEGEAGLLRWSARGSVAHGKFFLRLHVQAAPLVQCQRCLMPFAWPVDQSVKLELVRRESELDAEVADDEEDIDAPDKVLGSPRFDLLAQVEDELILAVPSITRHAVCPDLPLALKQQAQRAAEVQAQRVSPFAVLASLKDKQ